MHNIEAGLYKRKGKLTSNFEATLPKPQSDLARQTLKDPYIFDFLTIGNKAQEHEIEKGLIKNIAKFLLELGSGFSFVGSQYPLEISGKTFYTDLIFYHLRLRCYVVIELKCGDFKPEYAGKLNFYLSAIDKELKYMTDSPSIGLLLCKTNDRIIAEYALKDIAKPIGISEYKIVDSIPEKMKNNLPTKEELEDGLSRL